MMSSRPLLLKRTCEARASIGANGRDTWQRAGELKTIHPAELSS